MSNTDQDINDVAGKLGKLLNNETELLPEAEPELPPEVKLGKTQARNTVAPQPQESAPEEASAEEEEEVEDESPIEAPASWDDEAKEKWTKLPADVKALVSQRETERERVTNLRLQEAAEVRKQAETQTAQTTQLQHAYAQRLEVLGRQLEANIPAEFRNLKSHADLTDLAEKDPAAAQRFFVWRERAQGVLNEMQAVEQAKQQQAVQQHEQVLTREVKELETKWPEIVDPVRGPTLKNEISTLLGTFGFSKEEISGITDHRILMFTKKYMEGQAAIKALQAGKDKVLKKPLPKVVRPGQGGSTGPRAPDKMQLQKAAKSGNLSDTASALEKLLASS